MMGNEEQIRRIIARKSVNNKDESYLLYNADIFGNRALTWNSYQEIIESGWKGKVCMRSKKGIDRKKVEYNVPLINIPERIEYWRREYGIRESGISFNQSMPDKRLILQGEVIISESFGWYLLCTFEKVPMNQALEISSQTRTGLLAKLLLQHTLCPSSFADLEAILDRFPDSVVEFSTYEVAVGDIPNRNTIFWEVRNY